MIKKEDLSGLFNNITEKLEKMASIDMAILERFKDSGILLDDFEIVHFRTFSFKNVEYSVVPYSAESLDEVIKIIKAKSEEDKCFLYVPAKNPENYIKDGKVNMLFLNKSKI